MAHAGWPCKNSKLNRVCKTSVNVAAHAWTKYCPNWRVPSTKYSAHLPRRCRLVLLQVWRRRRLRRLHRLHRLQRLHWLHRLRLNKKCKAATATLRYAQLTAHTERNAESRNFGSVKQPRPGLCCQTRARRQAPAEFAELSP